LGWRKRRRRRKKKKKKKKKKKGRSKFSHFSIKKKKEG